MSTERIREKRKITLRKQKIVPKKRPSNRGSPGTTKKLLAQIQKVAKIGIIAVAAAMTESSVKIIMKFVVKIVLRRRIEAIIVEI